MITKVDYLLVQAEEAVAQHELAQSVALLEQACGISPRRADLWALLARVELKRCNFEGHHQAIGRAIRLRPKDISLHIRNALACPPFMESEEQITSIRSRIITSLDKLLHVAHRFQLKDPHKQIPTLNFYPGYHGYDERPINSRLFRLLRQLVPQRNYAASHVGRPQEGPLRVGIFSTSLRHHTIGRLFGPLVTRLDRERFQPVILIDEKYADDYTHELAGLAGASMIIPHHVMQASLHIEACELDILFYPDIGMDSFLSYLAMNRLATAQCVTWGHPITTGIDTIDTFLSIDTLESNHQDPPYTETLISQSLANIYYHPPICTETVSRHELGLPEGRLYGCPQTPFKFHPAYDHILLSILEHDPQGTLVLFKGNFPDIVDHFITRLDSKSPGASQRIHWLPMVPRTQYVQMLAALDVMLDPYPFGGGNTVLEALAVGTPVVTLPQTFARGRLAYTFYKQMKWTKLIATDEADYVALAIRCAKDQVFAQQVSNEIAENRNVLFENLNAVRQFEDLLAQSFTIGRQKFAAQH